MFNVLIDTSVWLDLAADPRQRPLLDQLQAFIELGHLQLIIPRLVVDEFMANKERVGKESVKGISSQVQQVKEAVKALEKNARRKKSLLEALDDIKHKAPRLAGGVEDALRHIELKFRAAKVVETTDAVRLAAGERALRLIAPCHDKKKNSFADAMLFETYLEAVRNGAARDRFAFVTHNKHEFSGTDWRKPHPHLEQHFTKIKSLYFVNLSELLKRIDPSAFSEIRYEQSWQQEPRNVSELQAAEYMLSQQVWHNRHMNREWQVAHGELKVVPELEWQKAWQTLEGDAKYEYARDHMSDAIWEAALNAARHTERELGKGNHGPWSDFEWGMINGKLSALRWVLGDDWDMLDT